MFDMATTDELPTTDELDAILTGRFASADDLADADNPILNNWEIFGLATAYEDRPPVTELVTGLFTEASLNIVFGAPGSLKSMLLLDLCACIAAGRPWLEPLPGYDVPQSPLPTVPGPVLWIDFDNAKRRTHDRVAAIARAYNLPPNAPLHYVSMPTPWLDAGNLPMMSHLARLIERHGIRFAVTDNLGLVTGDAEENSADMAQVMGNLRWLTDVSGAALTLIHHQRKSGSNDDSIRKGETLRGHSSIEAALDLALHVDRKPGDQIIITPTKTRDAPAFETAGALFTYQHKPDSRIMHAARFYGYTVESKADKEMGEIKNYALDVVAEYPGMSRQDLVTAIRDRMAGSGAKVPGINKTRDALRQLAEIGRIEVRETPKDGSPQPEIRHYPARP